MRSAGYFTISDRAVIRRAALMAEVLTQRYFDLGEDAWRRNPYNILTRREVGRTLCVEDAFANVVRFEYPKENVHKRVHTVDYGIVLHDPNILLALLRSSRPDLWTLGLFVLTHELIHIVRFREHAVDFFSPVPDRNEEESLVQSMTFEILSGVTNSEYVVELYNQRKSSVQSV